MNERNLNYNISPINVEANDSTTGNSYFNNYFATNVNVSPNVDATVLAYFEELSYNKESAKALASAVMYTAKSQGVDPMQALTEFTKLPKGQLNAYLVYFLNLQRKGTSLLGITNQPITNKYVSRTILL